MRQRPGIREVPKNQWGVALALTHYSEDMEPEEATSCSQAGTPVERQRYLPTHQTFNPKFILPTRNAGMGDGAETENGQPITGPT